ncbi:MAG: DUF3467 domain-containing protein [Anaerolineaceae bacterium]|jgi:hypothetical protein|nr:DUF3467 domain-containing protein [Anaerolineaceae bacterium]
MTTKRPINASKEIKIVWGSDQELPVQFVNQLLVSHLSQSEFNLIFGYLSPPLALKEEDFPDTLEVKPVVKLVITPEAMKQFLEVLNNNFEKFYMNKKNRV